jgi:hypothetical protein
LTTSLATITLAYAKRRLPYAHAQSRLLFGKAVKDLWHPPPGGLFFAAGAAIPPLDM